MPPAEREDQLRATLAMVAPGTGLRDGLERILRGNTGALIVLGYDRTVESLCTGGFQLDIDFSSTRLRELAKMDGAIVLTTDTLRILRAAVHLMPDRAVPTEEYGTRHRTAERTAIQTGFPVISVSQSMRIISLYVAGQRYVLENSGAVLSHAHQALATLERYKLRLDEVESTLSALEIEDLATARDVMSVAQRLEMVRRIANEIQGYVVELGVDGRLLALQLDELLDGVETERELLVRDYQPAGRKPATIPDVLREIAELPAGALVDLAQVGRAWGLTSGGDTLDAPVSPSGYRLLAKVPRLPSSVVERIIEHFQGMQQLLAASVEDLQAVEGVGEARARSIREGLSRLAESSILERYV